MFPASRQRGRSWVLPASQSDSQSVSQSASGDEIMSPSDAWTTPAVACQRSWSITISMWFAPPCLWTDRRHWIFAALLLVSLPTCFIFVLLPPCAWLPRQREKNPPSAVLSEVSSFSLFQILKFLLTQFGLSKGTGRWICRECNSLSEAYCHLIWLEQWIHQVKDETSGS